MEFGALGRIAALAAARVATTVRMGDKLLSRYLIADAITGGTPKAGKLRKASHKRKNIRDALRNSDNPAITAIGKYAKPLAEHLKASIRYSKIGVCRPETPITWDVGPIVNA